MCTIMETILNDDEVNPGKNHYPKQISCITATLITEEMQKEADECSHCFVYVLLILTGTNHQADLSLKSVYDISVFIQKQNVHCKWSLWDGIVYFQNYEKPNKIINLISCSHFGPVDSTGL